MPTNKACKDLANSLSIENKAEIKKIYIYGDSILFVLLFITFRMWWLLKEPFFFSEESPHFTS